MAASVDVIRSSLDSIRQKSEEIEGALVYLDYGALEALQLTGAVPLLLELGARAICSLEKMSPLDAVAEWTSTLLDPANKMVVITARLLSDAHRYILRCLGTHRTIIHCSIFTSISEAAHSAYIDSPLGPDAFREYESLLVQDYEELVKKSQEKELLLNEVSESRLSADSKRRQELASGGVESKIAYAEDYALRNDPTLAGITLSDDAPSHRKEKHEVIKLLVTVNHLPMIICPLSPRVFVLPSEGTIAEACLSTFSEDSLSPGLPSISTGMPSDGDDVAPGATLTANFLYHLAGKMDLKLEIFSLGETSRIIGKMLTDMSSLYDVGRRNKRSAGLLLIDRTLDLVTPCCHGDSIIDQMVSSLPRRERTKSALTARNLPIPAKNSLVTVERSTLDIRIPLHSIFIKEEGAGGGPQLSENINAFLSGWNSSADGNQNVEKDDQLEEANTGSGELDHSVLSGSLFSSYVGSNYLDVLMYRRAKDGLMLIKNWLLEVLQREKIPLNIKSRLKLSIASELHAIVSKLTSDENSLIRNKGIVQLALAAENALSEPHSSHWDAFVSAERILRISCGDTSQSLSNQIRDLINSSILLRSHDKNRLKESSKSLLSFQDALLLSMIGYMLAGENFPSSGSTSPFSWEEEHSLKDAVVDAIIDKPTSPRFKFLHGLEKDLEANSRKDKSEKRELPSADPSDDDDFGDQWGNWGDDDTEQTNESKYGDVQLKLELRDRVDNLFKLFHKLSGLRWRNPAYRGLLDYGSIGSEAYARKGLLYKILVTSLAKNDLPGLEYHSSTVGRFLKSGFGRFGIGQAKPSLGDQSLLLVFVVGGINCLEVCEAMEAISESRSDVELLMGGTTLLTPGDMFELLLGSSSYL